MSNSESESCDVSMRLVDLCEQVASGNYDKAKDIFKLDFAETAKPSTKILAEAFAMMVLRIEAREFELERLIAEISAARLELEKHRALLAEENQRLRAKVGKHTPSRLVGESPAMRTLFAQAERLARSNANVLITGETGSGKGVLARHIHDLSPRAASPFVDINCAAIPSSLLESELFGIEAGVASGVQSRIGRFEQAKGGTILLDEIGDMPLESQAKILHIIESGQVERVGGRKKITVNARIMAATHRNLETLVEEQSFRQDLFYRLNVVRLHVPPLRERPGDIPMLARSILASLADRFQDGPRRLSADALDLLMSCNWPGNIRELQNVLERASLLANGDKILPEDLLLSRSVGQTDLIAADTPLSVISDDGPPWQACTLDEAAATHIRRVLQSVDGNKTRAAKILGISREGLRIKLQRFEEE